MITRVINYPFLQYDDAFMYGFGEETFFILLNEYLKYHQIPLEYNSSVKTAFSGPFGKKYRCLVTPFGLHSAPAVFVSMIYDSHDQWVKIIETSIGFSNKH